MVEAQGFLALRGAIALAASSGYKLVIVVVANIITVHSPLSIDGDVTIISRGGAVLSGGGSNRLFEVSATGILRGENITFQDGYDEIGEGGAIRNYGGKVELNSCTLTGNYADGWGGALYNVDGRVELKNCELTGNSAREGGALFNDEDGQMKLKNCKLTGNSAIWRAGGGIRNYMGNVELDNCDLTDNYALLGGGAIFNWGSLKLNNCNLHRNNAGSGGAIANEAGDVELKYCNITENSAAGVSWRLRCARCRIARNPDRFHLIRPVLVVCFYLCVHCARSGNDLR